MNDKIVWPEPLVGVSLDEDLPLPDTPLQKAQMFWPKTKPKALLLALHGCGRQIGESPWMASWLYFFEKKEIGVILPSSFDDPRPPKRCGLPDRTNYEDYVVIDKLRIAQTKRTIREVRKAYPDLPLFLRGHSAGGFVAQAIDLDLAGVIVTGHACGLGDPRINLVRPSTPMLYILGENDKSLATFGKTVTPKAVRDHCGKSYETAKRRWVVVKGADHFPAISERDVATAVEKLLNR